MASGGFVIRSRDQGTHPQRWAAIGFDQAAREVELVFFREQDGTPVIFHANWATAGFKEEIRQTQRGTKRRGRKK